MYLLKTSKEQTGDRAKNPVIVVWSDALFVWQSDNSWHQTSTLATHLLNIVSVHFAHDDVLILLFCLFKRKASRQFKHQRNSVASSPLCDTIDDTLLHFALEYLQNEKRKSNFQRNKLKMNNEKKKTNAIQLWVVRSVGRLHLQH